jgi:hypothetical protein
MSSSTESAPLTLTQSQEYLNSIVCRDSDQYILSFLTENAQIFRAQTEEQNVLGGEVQPFKEYTENLFVFAHNVEEVTAEVVARYKEWGYKNMTFFVPEISPDVAVDDYIVTYDDIVTRFPLLNNVTTVHMLLPLCVAKLRANVTKKETKESEDYGFLLTGIERNYPHLQAGFANILMSWKGISIIEDMITWGRQEKTITKTVVNGAAKERVKRTSVKTSIREDVHGLSIYSCDFLDHVRAYIAQACKAWDATDKERPIYSVVYQFMQGEAEDEKTKEKKLLNGYYLEVHAYERVEEVLALFKNKHMALNKKYEVKVFNTDDNTLTMWCESRVAHLLLPHM